MVFARNLDKRQPRYRYSKTGDFTVLTWTLVYRLFAFFGREKGRIKQFAADFIFWVRVKNRVNYGSPLRQVKNQAQEHWYLSLIPGSFVYLPAFVRLKGVAHVKTKHRKNEGFFFGLKLYFLQQNTDNSRYNGIPFRQMFHLQFLVHFFEIFKTSPYISL